MTLTLLTVRARATAAALLMTSLAMAGFAATAVSNPALISKTGMSANVAESIARAVATLGRVPWWALLIIGGGIAGALVRIVIQYGWRYAATW